MTCQYHNKLQGYLDESLAQAEMELMEKHVGNCVQCQKELDNLLSTTLDLKVSLKEVDDEVLVSKIKARVSGLRRIFIYGFFGFVLGLFSRFYTMDKFIVTKAIMALPYKLAEFALGIFFSGYALSGQWMRGDYFLTGGVGYFPFNPVLDLIASLITPALIGAFMAVILGYLVSDKRVFQRKKIVNFIIGGMAVFLLWVGLLFGCYTYNLNTMAQLEGIEGATIYQVDEGGSSWVLRIDREALSQEKYAALVQGIEEAEETNEVFYPEVKKGYEILLNFARGGQIMAYVDEKTGQMILQNHKSYSLTPETLALLQEVAEVNTDE